MSHKVNLEDYTGKYKGQREWQKNNPDKIKEITKRYLENNREAYLARRKGYRERDKAKNAELGLPSPSKLNYEKYPYASRAWRKLKKRLGGCYAIIVTPVSVISGTTQNYCAKLLICWNLKNIHLVCKFVFRRGINGYC